MNFLKSIFGNKKGTSAWESTPGISQEAMGVPPQELKAKEDEFLANAAKVIKPCERTFEELEAYLIEKFNGVPYNLEHHSINTIKANIILNYFSHLIEKPEPFKENPSEAEIKEHILKMNRAFQQAREYPAEKLGLEFIGYKISKGSIPEIEEDVIIELEKTTKYISMSNGSMDLFFEINIYCGINERDIREKTPRFVQYAYGLKHFNKL